MSVHLPRPLLAVTIAVVAVVGACSDEGDQNGSPIDQGGGSDVRIDADSGDLQVETDDGSFTIGTDELPEGWPTEVPLPEGHRLTSSMTSGEQDQRSFSIGGTFSGPAGTTFDDVVAGFVANGWTEVQKGSTDVGDSTSASATFDNGTWTAVFSSTTTGAESTFAYTVVPSRT